METETFSTADVCALANEAFVNVKLNSDREKDLWTKFKGEVLPATFFVDAVSGETVATLNGFAGADDTAAALRRVPLAYAKLGAAKAAVEKSPKDEAAHEALAAIYTDLMRSDDAAAAYEKVCALVEPRKPLDDRGCASLSIAYWRLAEQRGQQQKFAEAAAYAEKLAAIDPQNKHGRLDDVQPWSAIASAMNGGLDEALKVVEEALKKWPDSNVADWLGFLEGAVWHEKGEEEKAKAAWKRTAEKFPKTGWGRRAKESAEHKH